MALRPKFLLLVCLGIAICAGAAASLYVRHRAASAAALLTGTRLIPGRELADFSLTDHQGRPFGPANLREHWSLMFFGYTNCPDFCPATLSTLAAVDKRLRAEKYAPLPQVVFVSVDAKRDTPEQLARYVPYFDPSFIGVTAASQEKIEAVAKKLGVPVIITPTKDGGYSVDHSGAIFVVDPKGRLAAILTGPFSVDAVTADWRRLVSGAA